MQLTLRISILFAVVLSACSATPSAGTAPTAGPTIAASRRSPTATGAPAVQAGPTPAESAPEATATAEPTTTDSTAAPTTLAEEPTTAPTTQAEKPTSAPAPTDTPPPPTKPPATAAPTATTLPTADEGSPPAVEEIAFILDGAVWKTPARGGGREKLTGGNNAAPAWSPAAYSLAYIRLQGKTGGGSLVVQPGGGGPARELAKDGVTQFAWSPNGDHIAYTRTTDADGDGRLVPDLDPSEVRALDVANGNDRELALGYDPSWAPDSDRVLLSTPGKMAQGYREKNELRLYDLSGKHVRTVARTSDVPNDLRKYGPPFLASTRLLRYGVISSDGETVAFSALGGVGVLGTVPLKGGAVQVQDTLVESDFGPIAWAPRGTRIAYEAPPPSGIDQVTILDVASGNRATLGNIRDRTGYRQPSWSPDGSSVALVQESLNGDKALVIAGATRKSLGRLALGDVVSPSWNRASGAGGGGAP